MAADKEPKTSHSKAETETSPSIEENESEDISDEQILAKHERALIEERRKFESYLKFPLTSRSRANRRIDSRGNESSGANTPDPTSPAPTSVADLEVSCEEMKINEAIFFRSRENLFKNVTKMKLIKIPMSAKKFLKKRIKYNRYLSKMNKCLIYKFISSFSQFHLPQRLVLQPN